MFTMGKGFKVFVGLAAVAGAAAAIYTLKKRKEMEEYDYEV